MSIETKNQSGQSLIETIIALFVLTTGLISGLALAIFTFGTSSEITNQLTATGLAREGIEAVRSKRDSNWLSGTLVDCGADLGLNQDCYQNWLNGINGPSGGQAYKIIFDPAIQTASKWSIVPAANNYQLYRQGDGTFSHTVSGTPTQFFRKVIVINKNTDNPSAETQVLVRSAVWWHGKRCPEITDYNNPSNTPCREVSEEYLTNWRNY